ncbi:DUF5994 family protein [Streptomyces sp. ND04-05B]|uniref:DUF5994 family protein n=1 Tax=Streptomyces sp. ND04-05B TaxID=3028693 RepID=UPI0029BE4506|nr:DUF5994 family protein [Streptomyces sp. ND04-05B]MDX3066124.1 DUF5994 family protein [Streptomyces sp. ND04-05B]
MADSGSGSRSDPRSGSRSDSPQVTGHLPDDAHQAVRPGTALVRLETTHDRQGVLDGVWWPRSRDIAAELPGLIGALTEHLGPIMRVGLDTGAWEDLPTRMTIDDRVVRVDSFPVGDDTVLVTRGEGDLFSLLVVPPHATPDAARAAMTEAVRAGSGRRAEQILIDTGTGRTDPSTTQAHVGGVQSPGEQPGEQPRGA